MQKLKTTPDPSPLTMSPPRTDNNRERWRILMLSFLKKAWQDARKRAEEDDQVRASSSQAAPGRACGVDMPSVAGEFATKLAGRGLALDFTPASLPLVDRVLTSAVKELALIPGPDRKTQESHTCLKIAAYVGEVLRREEG